MAVEPQPNDQNQLRFTQSDTEKRSRAPWIVAGVMVVLGIGLLALFGGRKGPAVAAPGLTSLDPYAAQLVIDGLKMSEASNFAGGKVTYLDGKVTNSGSKTVSGVTVQVAFRNDLKEVAQKETTPLNLIRTHDPYVDIQPVSAAPLKPGDQREFRLIFDSVAADWNQQYPEVRIVMVTTK